MSLKSMTMTSRILHGDVPCWSVALQEAIVQLFSLSMYMLLGHRQVH